MNHPGSKVAEPPTATAPRHSAMKGLVFSSVILAALVVAQEACFRFVFPLPEVDGFNRNNYQKLQVSDARLKYIREKGVSRAILRVRSEPDGYVFDHTLNFFGFRDADFSIDPPRDRDRVLFVGDSFVEGIGTDDNGTIPRRFAAALKRVKPVEAINLGVGGIGFPEYVRIVRDAVPLLRPKTLFLVVFANDLPAPAYPDDGDGPAVSTTKTHGFGVRAIEVARRLKQNKPVPRFYHSGPFPLFEAAPSPSNPWTGHDDPTVDPRLVAAFRRGGANPWLEAQAKQIAGNLQGDFSRTGGADRHLERIASICRDAGVRLIVAYIPFSTNVNSAYLPALYQLGYRAPGPDASMESPAFHAQQLHLRDVTDRLHIPFLDLTGEYIEAEKTRGRMYWTYDAHCNPQGYRLAAAACARYYAEGVVPKPNRAVESLRLARSASVIRR